MESFILKKTAKAGCGICFCLAGNHRPIEGYGNGICWLNQTWKCQSRIPVNVWNATHWPPQSLCTVHHADIHPDPGPVRFLWNVLFQNIFKSHFLWTSIYRFELDISDLISVSCFVRSALSIHSIFYLFSDSASDASGHHQIVEHLIDGQTTEYSIYLWITDSNEWNRIDIEFATDCEHGFVSNRRSKMFLFDCFGIERGLWTLYIWPLAFDFQPEFELRLMICFIDCGRTAAALDWLHNRRCRFIGFGENLTKYIIDMVNLFDYGIWYDNYVIIDKDNEIMIHMFSNFAK